MQFLIPADTIKALLAIAPKNDIRKYLNSVCIDVRATDAVAVATDGHKLIAVGLVCDDGDYVPGQYILPREALEGIKSTLKQPVRVTLDLVTRSAFVDGYPTRVTIAIMDEHYPDWRKVVPLTVSGEPAQYNAEYIAAFGKAHKLLGGKYSPGILHNGYGAARIVLAGDAIGVLMPMRLDLAPLDNPSWLLTPSAPVAAAA